MKVYVEHDGVFLPPTVKQGAIKVTDHCLNQIRTSGENFIVNDTVCFRKQRGGRITNCVMNTASFLSSAFQSNLGMIDGCAGETKIDGQNIDGMININIDVVGYRIIDKDNILSVVHSYMYENNLPDQSVYTLFPMFYGMYVERSIYDIAALPDSVHNLFEPVSGIKNFRLGVEFETGNVASSFRALNKLFVLFQSGHIDAGVFITSHSKSTSACRIWPVSNRNGSFEELNQRRYMEQVSLPLISVGFAPDGFNSQAPFLGKYGNLYHLTPTGETDETGKYGVFIDEDGEEILKPLGM